MTECLRRFAKVAEAAGGEPEGSEDLQGFRRLGGLLDQPGLFEGGVGIVLVNGLEGLATGLDLDVASQLGDPDPLLLEVGGDRTLDGLGHVTADSALLLGQSGTVDPAAHAGAGTSNAADS